jgi:hypothetical protein
MIVRIGSTFLFASAVACAAVAQTPAPNAQSPRAAASDERICETITVTGSRLGKKKICATRAEWAERRRQDHDVVDGFQTLTRNPCNSVNQDRGAGNC